MNKKGGTKLILKTLVSLVIAIAVIVVLLNVMDKFILFGKDEPNQQLDFFNELNNKIKTGANQEKQIFQLEDNYLLISFNNQDTQVNAEKVIRVKVGGIKPIKINTLIKKPPLSTNSLCLCKTKEKDYLFENDCLQEEDICIEHKKEINLSPLFVSKLYNLKISKTINNIRIEHE